MEIAVFADTHGNSGRIPEAIAGTGPVDLIVHLGDGAADGQYLASELGRPFFGVRGNEDFGSTLPEHGLLTVGRWRLLAVHGHQWDLNPYLSHQVWTDLLDEMSVDAKRSGAQVLLFGHTHQPHLEERNGILMCNPGNQYLGSSSPPTFARLKIDPDHLQVGILERRSDGGWSMIKEGSLTRTIGGGPRIWAAEKSAPPIFEF